MFMDSNFVDHSPDRTHIVTCESLSIDTTEAYSKWLGFTLPLHLPPSSLYHSLVWANHFVFWRYSL